MRSFREYINIIKESETPEWQRVVAQEVSGRGLPQKVWCGIRYTTYYYFAINFTDGRKLYVGLEAYGKGDAVAFGTTSNVDEDTLGFLYGPDIGVEYVPAYSDAASLCETIEQFCLSANDDAIYYDKESHWDKGGSITSVEGEGFDDPEGFYTKLVNDAGFGDDNFSFMFSGISGDLGVDGIESVEQYEEDLERDIGEMPLGAAYVVWPNFLMLFEGKNGHVELVSRGKSQNRFTGEITPLDDEPKSAPPITSIPGVPRASKQLIDMVNQVPAERQKSALADIAKVSKMGASEEQIIASLKDDYLK